MTDEQRYLLQTQFNSGKIDYSIYNWTEVLSLKKDMRELSKEDAEKVLKGEALPTVSNTLLQEEPGMVAMLVPVEKVDMVKAVINSPVIEDGGVDNLNEPLDLPQPTEEEVEPAFLPDEKRDKSYDVIKIESFKNPKDVIKYMSSTHEYDINSKLTLDEMKTDAINFINLD